MSDEELVRRQRNRQLVRDVILIFAGAVALLGGIKLSFWLFW